MSPIAQQHRRRRLRQASAIRKEAHLKQVQFAEQLWAMMSPPFGYDAPLPGENYVKVPIH